MSTTTGTDDAASTGGLALVTGLWPLLLATFVYTLPIVATNIFVAPIAADLDTSAAVVGSMRAIAGAAALSVGVLLAPLLDRAPRALIVTGGLLLGAVAAAFAMAGSLTSLLVFDVLLGATMAIVLPTLQAASADRFTGPAGGQAVSMITSFQALANIVAGPLLAVPAMVAGWRGAFVAIAVLAVAVAGVATLTLSWRRPPNVARPGYRAAFAMVAAAPGATPLLAASMLRSCVWFAWLTYLAAFFTDQFEASTGLVAWVWFLGAGAYFLANLFTGRLVNPTDDRPMRPWQSPTRLLVVSTIANVALVPLVFISPTVPLALAATALFCVTSGVLLSSLMSLLIRRYAPMRGAMMGLNAVGLNVGMIAGASLAGVGLGIGGYVGLAATLVLMAGAAAGVILVAVRSLHEPAPPETAVPA